eukprot:CAMPEP_0172665672 /NCGR_PEP_ID=MMETSP1074-20121228/7388_1 /TAXON_ID=2916 /ORGANISM="Ceratium fusus, Strain PA161109" /LENGTH=395 /DNA_ID=CAMNT_0013482013 /DNA_START=88 /DNA_END=1275 /DNA_ORIENTATION=+
MEEQRRRRLQYAALGGTCAAVLVSLAVIRRRAAKRNDGDRKLQNEALTTPTAKVLTAVTKESQPMAVVAAPKSIVLKTQSSKASVPVPKSFDELDSWAASLKKKQVSELPTLLASTERLLKEQPDHKAMPQCLKTLAQLVGGHQELDRVSALAVRAGERFPEKAFDVLNALFKDRRQKCGHVADTAVVEFAVTTLRRSMEGGVERGIYQRACRLIDWLSLDPENRACLASLGGLDTLLQLMRRFHDDPGVLLEGCGSLQSLAEEPSLDVAEAAGVAVSCLRTFPENPELSWRALAVLHGLPLPAESPRLPMAELAVSAATKHPRCDVPTTVIEWAAKLLHKLATERDSEVLTWLRDPVHRPFLQSLQAAPHASVRGSINKEAERWALAVCRICLS